MRKLLDTTVVLIVACLQIQGALSEEGWSTQHGLEEYGCKGACIAHYENCRDGSWAGGASVKGVCEDGIHYSEHYSEPGCQGDIVTKNHEGPKSCSKHGDDSREHFELKWCDANGTAMASNCEDAEPEFDPNEHYGCDPAIIEPKKASCPESPATCEDLQCHINAYPGGCQDLPGFYKWVDDNYVKAPGSPFEGCAPDYPLGSATKVSGDPITIFNGKRIQFWLPVNHFIALLGVGPFLLLGKSRDYANIAGQQWLTDFIFKQNGEEILRVSAADPETLMLNHTTMKSDSQNDDKSLKTLIVSTKSEGRGQEVVQVGKTSIGNGDVELAVKQHHPRIGTGHKEALTIHTTQLSLRLVSAVAKKFATDEEQIRHLHIDMDIQKLDYKSATGVLPELWGLKPLSPETKPMLASPKDSIMI